MRILEPTRASVLLKRVPQTKSMGGIVLPQSGEAYSEEGEVVAVGKGYLSSFGTWIKPLINVGDVVLYAPQGPGHVELNFEGEEYILLLDDSYIFSLIKGEKSD